MPLAPNIHLGEPTPVVCYRIEALNMSLVFVAQLCVFFLAYWDTSCSSDIDEAAIGGCRVLHPWNAHFLLLVFLKDTCAVSRQLDTISGIHAPAREEYFFAHLDAAPVHHVLSKAHLNFACFVMIDLKLKYSQRVSLIRSAADEYGFLWVDLFELDLDS